MELGRQTVSTLNKQRFSLVIEGDAVEDGEVGAMRFMVRSLPHECIAMRPDSIVFADATEWTIDSIVFGSVEQDIAPNPSCSRVAGSVTEAVNDRVVVLDTIQTAMSIEIVAIPARTGLKFWCMLSGPAVMQ